MVGALGEAFSVPAATRCCTAAVDAGARRWQAGHSAQAPAMHDPRLDSLRSALPGLRLATAPEDLLHYGRDWTRRWTPAPLAVALPGDTLEVQAVLRWASAEG